MAKDDLALGSEHRYLQERIKREHGTADDLRSALADYVHLSDRVMEAVTKVVVENPLICASPESAKVNSILLARLLNDQRACVRAAQDGYVLQAVTIAAGMLELANAAAFIGADEQRANRWLSHTDIAHTYPSDVKQSIHAACQLLGLPKAAEDHEYNNYRMLCMGKHSNPIALSQLGVQHADDGIHVHIGPYFDAGVVRAARSAIASATRSVWLAAMVFLHHHAPAARRDAMAVEMSPLGARMLELSERDKAA